MKLYQRILAIVVSLPLIVVWCFLIGQFRVLMIFGLESGLESMFEENTIILFALSGIAAAIALLTVVLVISLSCMMMALFERYLSR
ncbi:MAG: hypothetical protein ACIAZJ_19990 [Gimesia chilikensis]|uniref:hypothetical protein n=1 Tax=Gimesia chilikensis TaxID=2605989 RepID=UPI0037A86EA0